MHDQAQSIGYDCLLTPELRCNRNSPRSFSLRFAPLKRTNLWFRVVSCYIATGWIGAAYPSRLYFRFSSIQAVFRFSCSHFEHTVLGVTPCLPWKPSHVMHYERIHRDEYKYIKRVYQHMKLFDSVIEKMELFNTKCEYGSICTRYTNDSYICTKEVDKSYCGVYKQFVKKPKILYTDA